MNKRGQIWGELTPWLIGLAVLAIVLIFVYFMKDRLAEMGRYIIDLFRGGA